MFRCYWLEKLTCADFSTLGDDVSDVGFAGQVDISGLHT